MARRAESAYGEWAVEDGLPVFREGVHPDDPVCGWDPIVAPQTNRHWCAVGNRRLQIVVDNLGTTAILDTAHGFRWLTPSDPGSGATIVRVIGGRQSDSWGTDRPRWPADWSPSNAPVRTWGPTWASLVGHHDGVRVERAVLCPDGEWPWLVVRVCLSSDVARTIEVAEEWHLAVGGEVTIDSCGATLCGGVPTEGGEPFSVRLCSAAEPDRVEVDEAADRTHTSVRLVQRVDLAQDEPVVWWLTLGLPHEMPEPSDPEALWSASLTALKRRLPSASCARVAALAREVPWHAALLSGGACLDAKLGGHTLDQGSAYSFDLGFNGAARDPLQHALPLVYTEPDLALSVLRNTCAWAGPSGELPYALDRAKMPVTFGFEPSDQALWSLWLAAEYGAATGDLAAFGALTPFHPVHDAPPAPLIDHLVGQLRHLIDVVGVGEHGHIRMRNADWNDSALTLAGIDRATMQAHGESVLNSAMAAWVLPRFAGLLRRLGGTDHGAVANEADERAARWRTLVAGEWNGRWYRRAYGPGAVVGDDELWLEVQPWAILCGAADPARARELLATIDAVVRLDSPLGARVRGPAPIRVPEGRVAGEGSAGGVWFSINMTLAWAAASINPDLAWDELRRMTLDAHTAAYPSIWEGTISGPDAYNTPESPRPGSTWAWPDRGIGMQSFPVNNLHAHAQVILTYLRLLGVEPNADGSLAVGGRDGSFSSEVLSLHGDGHGHLDTIGSVRAVTPYGVVEGSGRLSW